MRKILKTLKNLSFGLTTKMMLALLSKPLLALPTIWATVESILFSELYFREAHGGRGVANAFRHAAWNLLIAQNSSHFTSVEKAVDWAKYITDLHEICFPNDSFDEQMDLHNNRIGREIFRTLKSQGKSKKEMIEFLFEKTRTAAGLFHERDFHQFPKDMVYFDSKKIP